MLAEDVLSKQQTPFDFGCSTFGSPSSANQAEAGIMKFCSVKDCEREHYGLGYCNAHYQQIRRNGKITLIEIPTIGEYSHLTMCRVDGCNTEPDRLGYCTKHYMQDRTGKLGERTRFDKNKIILHENYAEIELYNQKQEVIAKTKIDLEDINKVKNYKWFYNGRYCNTLTYNRRITIARLLLDLGDYKGYIEADHRNGDKLDNRKINLRRVTPLQNMWNRTINKNNTSGINGIYYENGWWRARIENYDKKFNLYCGKDKDKAIKIRKIAEEEIKKIVFHSNLQKNEIKKKIESFIDSIKLEVQ